MVEGKVGMEGLDGGGHVIDSHGREARCGDGVAGDGTREEVDGEDMRVTVKADDDGSVARGEGVVGVLVEDGGLRGFVEGEEMDGKQGGQGGEERVGVED